MKSSEPARFVSTYSAPSTCFRVLRPFSNSSLSAIACPLLSFRSDAFEANIVKLPFLRRIARSACLACLRDDAGDGQVTEVGRGAQSGANAADLWALDAKTLTQKMGQ